MCSHLLYSLRHIRSNRVSAESGRFPKKHAASSFPRCGRTTFSTVQNALGCAARRRRPVDTPSSYSGHNLFSRAFVTVIIIVINITTYIILYIITSTTADLEKNIRNGLEYRFWVRCSHIVFQKDL